MKHKTKSAAATARPSRASLRVVSPDPIRETVHIHPNRAEFFLPGAADPHSRIANGPAGSDAADRLADAIADRNPIVKHFDAAGRPVA